jgi:undecaprenyl-diphosphatase
VSSTGHLILASHYMGLSGGGGEGGRQFSAAPALDTFEIVIQAGAILAVLGLYRRRVGEMVLGLAGRNPAGLRLVGLLLVAFLPAAAVGLLLRDLIKAHLFSPVTVALALAAGGCVMIGVEYWFRRRAVSRPPAGDVTCLRWSQALCIGLLQCLALCPGTSRSMVTILGGVLVGLDMVAAAEFSFLLALPTLGAATLYEGWSERGALAADVGVLPLLLGIVVSAVVAALSVKGLVRWLTGHGLTPFGIYRVLVAALVAATFLG